MYEVLSDINVLEKVTDEDIEKSILEAIIEQIPKNAQTYPIRAKSSSTGAWLAPH